MDTRRKTLDRRIQSMATERSSFNAHWSELARFVAPRRSRFFVSDVNKGDIRWHSIVNSSATQALRIFRAGLLTGIMSPARPWFSLRTPDSDLNRFQPVQDWLYQTELLLRDIFNQSNLYNMAPIMLGELGLFGTGCMMQVDDFHDVTRFYTHTVGSYYLAQNSRFEVDTMGREWQMTAEQIVGEYGLPNVSSAVRSAYDAGTYDARFTVRQFIGPNPDMDPRKTDAKFKPFVSVTWEPGSNDDKLLRESGFNEFPVHCPRWEVTGEDIYGTDCPGMTALGDVKGLQIMERKKAAAVEKMVSPPVQAPVSMKNVPLAMMPGGASFYDGSGDGALIRPIYQVNPQVQELGMDMKRTEDRINQAFFVDLFQSISSMEGVQPQNQLYLTQKNQEKLLQLAPTLERLHGEFLNGLIDRTFNQCVRANILPPPPPELQGQALRAQYVSPLAMAQHAEVTGTIERFTYFVGGLTGTHPEAGDKLNVDEAINEYAAATSVPPRLVNSDEQVQATRAARAKQQQAEQAIATAQSAANTTKMLSDAKTTDPSVLTAASQALGGAAMPR